MKGKQAKAGSITRNHVHMEGIFASSLQEFEGKLNWSIKG